MCNKTESKDVIYIYLRVSPEKESEYDDVSCNIYILGRLIFSVP